MFHRSLFPWREVQEVAIVLPREYLHVLYAYSCSCSRALQAKEMAEINAPFVPLKDSRPNEIRDLEMMGNV